MPLIVISENPVYAALEHDGTQVGTIDLGEWGIHPIYEIEKVHWEEREGLSWRIVVEHPSTGQPIDRIIDPFESGSINLAVPARFESQPLEMHITLERV